jgi:O-6-methylguanine DNA methyltransferase
LAARRSASASASASRRSSGAGGPPGATAFARRVLAVVRSIPAGRVATYGDVAVLAGRLGAARAVGNVMRGCADPTVPCHRVIAAGGALGGYGPDPTRKKLRLAAEGVTFAGRRVRRFAQIRWPDDGAATPRRRRPV